MLNFVFWALTMMALRVEIFSENGFEPSSMAVAPKDSLYNVNLDGEKYLCFVPVVRSMQSHCASDFGKDRENASCFLRQPVGSS